MIIVAPSVSSVVKPQIIGAEIGFNQLAPTIPAHQAGDLILVYAHNTNGLPTPPSAGGTVPTWTTINSLSGNGGYIGRIAYAFATSSSTTLGNWGSAYGSAYLSVVAISGAVSVGASAMSRTGGVTTTVSVAAPAVTMTNNSGSSLLLHCGFTSASANAAWSPAPNGYTNIAKFDNADYAQGTIYTRIISKDDTTSDGSVIIGTLPGNVTYADYQITSTVEIK